ncbi:MAG: hypothetical protein L0154_28400 [Chloroflexi bacterium]|nr:hypothetical protein [Chloroflexota bacterium]
MAQATFESVLAQAEQLTPQDRLRLVERLAATLQTELKPVKSNWHAALRATYGILKDDPIERPPQLPLEERDPLA